MTTWMIVEDEPGIYEMLLAMSEVLGNEGIAFVDGDEAIAWVDEVDGGRFEGELPELALVDIRLPTNTSGPMVGARLRKSPNVGPTPHEFLHQVGPDEPIGSGHQHLLRTQRHRNEASTLLPALCYPSFAGTSVTRKGLTEGPRTRAGTPTALTSGSISWTTTAPAPTTDLAPTERP